MLNKKYVGKKPSTMAHKRTVIFLPTNTGKINDQPTSYQINDYLSSHNIIKQAADCRFTKKN